MIPLILGILACIIVAGFFAGSETGAYRLNRIRLRHQAESGSVIARMLTRTVGNMERFVCMTLIGTNASVYAATGLFTALVAIVSARDGASPKGVEFVSTLILAPVLLVLTDLLPKSIFTVMPNRLMRWTAPVLWLVLCLVYPIVIALYAMVCFWRRLVGGQTESRQIVVSAHHFDYLLSEGREEGAITPQQDLMMRNIMQLRQRPVEQSMIPLDQMAMISADAAGPKALATIRDHNHARLPVYDGERGNVVGLLLTLDYLSQSAHGPAHDYAHELGHVPATASLAHVFRQLQTAGRAMAAVVDPQGRTLGFVTMGTLLQEIFASLDEV
jgi:magnesium and cobalt exporter, CNNM family